MAENDLYAGVKPPGTREFTLRAVITGVIVAVIMGASYPYVVLKLGFGPNVSVVAAFFGYLFLGLLFRNFNRFENNIVQSAGTSAAQTAFMCVILAAFDLVSQNPKLHYSFAPTPFQAFLWLTFGSILGILMAVPLRRHYIVDEKLTFADGVAAAETVIVLDARGKDARAGAWALGLGTVASALVWVLTTKWGGELLPEILFAGMAGLTVPAMAAGFGVSFLALGSGMIVGNRINISMAIGGVIAWIIGPYLLCPSHGILDVVHVEDRNHILLWMMWPGTGMLIAAGLTSLFIKWRTLARSFSAMSSKSIDSAEFPLAWVGIGIGVSAVGMVIVQYAFFDVPWWLTIIAVLLSGPLMLVGLRVLGETNWGPISQLSNLTQAIFAAIAPGNLTTNLAASGTAGTIAVQSEAIMQVYKTGDMIGSTPKYLTYAQLIAAPVGAAAVALAYPLFKSTYGVGGDTGLASPISRRIEGFAEVLSSGADALPQYAMYALVIGAILGILIAVGETRWSKYLPSPTGLGIGMMVPGNVVFTMVLGGVAFSLWQRYDRKSADKLGMPLASGLIAGEAVMAIVIPVLIAIGLVSP